jgi:transcription antitermination factor NusG
MLDASARGAGFALPQAQRLHDLLATQAPRRAWPQDRRDAAALFPGYLFIAIELQWRAARWSPGVAGLIMDGIAPARVPDKVIDEIRARERGGLIELPPRLKRGDPVRIEHGPFEGWPGSTPDRRRKSVSSSCSR